MHHAQWSPERPLPPPVSLASQSHHEKPPEVTCTSRGNPGFPASTRESPRETFFNPSRGQSPLPWLGSNDAFPARLIRITEQPKQADHLGRCMYSRIEAVQVQVASVLGDIIKFDHFVEVLTGGDEFTLV